MNLKARARPGPRKDLARRILVIPSRIFFLRILHRFIDDRIGGKEADCATGEQGH